MDSLEDVAHEVRACTDCPLHRGRTNAVPGEGSPNADLLFIGEGPGFHEDRQGRPFVGPAGQLLEGLLASIGTNRDEVFIANMIKCRPPDNRDPQPPEIAACSKYLDRQIELINPKLIITLGRFSLGRFFPGESVTRARGQLRQKNGLRIFPVMHPAAALRRPEWRTTLVQDFRAIADALAVDPEPDLVDASEAREESIAGGPVPASQMGLFGGFAAPPAPITSDPSGDGEVPDQSTGKDEQQRSADPHQLSMF